MEGLYLHNLIFLALFTDSSAITIYIILGWGTCYDANEKYLSYTLFWDTCSYLLCAVDVSSETSLHVCIIHPFKFD
jgi:hypothetical protein